MGYQLHKKLRWFVIGIGLFALVLFETTWRLRVEGGKEWIAVVQWISSNADILKTVGRIESIESKRIHSNFSWGFDGNMHGRFHIIINGNKINMDVIVSWHNSKSNSVEVDKIETWPGLEVIWPLSKK